MGNRFGKGLERDKGGALRPLCPRFLLQFQVAVMARRSIVER